MCFNLGKHENVQYIEETRKYRVSGTKPCVFQVWIWSDHVNGNKWKTCFRNVTLWTFRSDYVDWNKKRFHISGTLPCVSAHVNTKVRLRKHLFPSTETWRKHVKKWYGSAVTAATETQVNVTKPTAETRVNHRVSATFSHISATFLFTDSWYFVLCILFLFALITHDPPTSAESSITGFFCHRSNLFCFNI